MNSFKEEILQGIPKTLPPAYTIDDSINHAPKRKDLLTPKEKRLAVENALRYFSKEFHSELASEFFIELKKFGRIYMHRFRPAYEMQARPIEQYPHQTIQAAAIMHMLQNNLDPRIAQHPHELVTYGGNGSVFQNWAQYLLTMKYLAEMSNRQTLVLYSGHPLGLFPSHPEAPRVVVTNGMMIPNYSKQDDLEKFNALGVTQYGQMTAGSFMYIGPQGIVHGTMITILNAGRKISPQSKDPLKGKLFVSSGLGGMSGAQPKAVVIAGAVALIAEINPQATQKRHEQGWVNEVFDDVDQVINRALDAKKRREAVSLAFQGNIVDLWSKLAERKIEVELGSDQTSLHNPFAGGYYPQGLSLEESNQLMVSDPSKFKDKVYESLRKQAQAIHQLTQQGMYFFDYGNAFLLECSRAGAKIQNTDGTFIYPSYVQDIMGPICFDYGFGPFRWVCTSGNPQDLKVSDQIAARVIEGLIKQAPNEIKTQLQDNLNWIKAAEKNDLTIGSQARILYSNADGRIQIAKAFNEAIRSGKISKPIVLGRDHHDVSGTDSPFRETSNVYDGSQFTADMAVQNFVGDSFRGATWVSLHNGGGVGWGEVINGGFGMVLDGSVKIDQQIEEMLFWDVNNGIARRSWARSNEACFAIQEAMKKEPNLTVTLPERVDKDILDQL